MEELEPLLKELGPLFKLLVLWAFKGHNFWLAVAGVVSLFAFALIISLLRALFKKAELVPFRETESRPPVNFPVEGNSLDRGQDFNFCKLCEQRVEHVGEICVSCRARTLSGTLSIKDPLPPADWLSGIPDAARPRLLPRLRPEPCQYGLTLERWRYFHGEKSGKPWTRFCPFLFWASFAVLVLLKPPPSAFFVFLALFALAAIVVVQLEKAISRLSKRRKESQHDYQNYARYERDCEQYYQGLHLLKLEEQKAELRELRRREEALRRHSARRFPDGQTYEFQITWRICLRRAAHSSVENRRGETSIIRGKALKMATGVQRVPSRVGKAR